MQVTDEHTTRFEKHRLCSSNLSTYGKMSFHRSCKSFGLHFDKRGTPPAIPYHVHRKKRLLNIILAFLRKVHQTVTIFLTVQLVLPYCLTAFWRARSSWGFHAIFTWEVHVYNVSTTRSLRLDDPIESTPTYLHTKGRAKGNSCQAHAVSPFRCTHACFLGVRVLS